MMVRFLFKSRCGACPYADNPIRRRSKLPALYSNIFMVAAIVASPTSVGAITQSALAANAVDVIHPDLTTAAGKPLNVGATCEAKLPAHNLRIVIVEVVVTDSAPRPVAENLHPSS